MDQVPYLSVTPGKFDFQCYRSIHVPSFLRIAMAFRKWLGGEDKINSYCHNLAIEGGKRLAELLNTQVMDKTGELTLNMVTVKYNIEHEQLC